MEEAIIVEVGPLALIKRTLANFPTYFMSVFPIPACVAKRPEKLEKEFLWGGRMEERKFHLVDWDTVYSSIWEGGLGIKKLQVFNNSLLG